MPAQSRLSAFVDELRRRRVFRVAAFYGGIAFVIIQIIDGTFDLMGVPVWVGRVLLLLLAIGFPVSMVLAWVTNPSKQPGEAAPEAAGSQLVGNVRHRLHSGRYASQVSALPKFRDRSG